MYMSITPMLPDSIFANLFHIIWSPWFSLVQWGWRCEDKGSEVVALRLPSQPTQSGEEAEEDAHINTAHTRPLFIWISPL